MRLRDPSVVRALHPIARRKVWAAIDAVRGDPEIGKALGRELKGLRTLRVGGLRIVYQVVGLVVEVVLIGRRPTIYDEVARIRRRERG